MQKLYVSNKNESVRMFESNFMEFFSHVHPATPLILYLPLTAFLLFFSVAYRNLSWFGIAALFAAGVLLWTLLEYVIHRYFFHYQPKTRWGKRFHFMVHGVHHDYPQDATRLVMPPALSLPIAVVLYLLFALIFGRFTQAIFAGVVFGYICYDCIHYATHHIAMKGRVGLWLKRYHLHHHYQDDHAGYGISSPLWDYVFRSRRKMESVPELPPD